MTVEKHEPGSLDTIPDPYADFNPVQLKSTLKAKDKEIERLQQKIMEDGREHAADVGHYKKKIGELESTIKMQLDTIGTQHDTLNAREKIVGELQARLENATDPQPTKNAVEPGEVGDLILADLSQSMQLYGVRIAVNAQNENSALTAIHVIQLAETISQHENFAGLLQWLKHGK